MAHEQRMPLLHGMWDPPGLGFEPLSPALAGGFSTTAPPGKSPGGLLLNLFSLVLELLFPQFSYHQGYSSA